MRALRHRLDHLLLAASVFAAGFLTCRLHQYHGHMQASSQHERASAQPSAERHDRAADQPGSREPAALGDGDPHDASVLADAAVSPATDHQACTKCLGCVNANGDARPRGLPRPDPGP